MLDIVNSIIDGLVTAGKSVVNLLPQSPFQAYTTFPIDAQYIRWMNWLVPVGQIIVILEGWVLAIAIWYLYQIILRWAKAIQ